MWFIIPYALDFSWEDFPSDNNNYRLVEWLAPMPFNWKFTSFVWHSLLDYRLLSLQIWLFTESPLTIIRSSIARRMMTRSQSVMIFCYRVSSIRINCRHQSQSRVDSFQIPRKMQISHNCSKNKWFIHSILISYSKIMKSYIKLDLVRGITTNMISYHLNAREWQ